MESLIVNNDKLKVSFTVIYGDRNEIIGNNNTIYGDHNEIIGNNNIVYGEGNQIVLSSPTPQGKVYRTSSRKKINNIPVNNYTKIPEYEKGSHSSNNDNICIICLENTKSTVCIPCGHVIYCIPCIHNISKTMKLINCSVCRQPITEIMKVFLS